VWLALVQTLSPSAAWSWISRIIPHPGAMSSATQRRTRSAPWLVGYARVEGRGMDWGDRSGHHPDHFVTPLQWLQFLPKVLGRQAGRRL